MADRRSPVASLAGEGLELHAARRPVDADRLMYWLAHGAVLVVFGMLVSLVLVLLHGAMPSIRTFGFHFLTTADWRTKPTVMRDPITHKLLHDACGKLIHLPGDTYGALAVMYGTAVTSFIALLLAIPPSFAAAIFLVRAAPRWLAAPVSFLVEFLAAIPSLAYGLWGMFVLCPFLAGRLSIPHWMILLIDWVHARRFFHDADVDQIHKAFGEAATTPFTYPGTHEPLVYFNGVEPFLSHLFAAVPGLRWLASGTGMLSGRDILAGGIILAIMILPIITAVSRDVLRAVPRAQVEGAVALGATWWQSCLEMLKYSRGGLFGAVTLGLARAAGETMAVSMVIGINTQIKMSPFEPAQTMSSLLAINFGDVSAGLEKASMVEVALILLAMSLLFNLIARYLVIGKTIRSAAAA